MNFAQDSDGATYEMAAIAGDVTSGYATLTLGIAA